MYNSQFVSLNVILFSFSQFGNFLAVKQKKMMKTESFLSNTVIMFADVSALSVQTG